MVIPTVTAREKSCHCRRTLCFPASCGSDRAGSANTSSNLRQVQTASGTGPIGDRARWESSRRDKGVASTFPAASVSALTLTPASRRQAAGHQSGGNTTRKRPCFHHQACSGRVSFVGYVTRGERTALVCPPCGWRGFRALSAWRNGQHSVERLRELSSASQGERRNLTRRGVLFSLHLGDWLGPVVGFGHERPPVRTTGITHCAALFLRDQGGRSPVELTAHLHHTVHLFFTELPASAASSIHRDPTTLGSQHSVQPSRRP